MTTQVLQGSDVVDFWRQAGPEKFFPAVEPSGRTFHDRFLDQHERAAAGELGDWLNQPYSALALLLLLDQFPRNCFRGTQRVCATDPLARQVARKALAAGFDEHVDRDLRVFFYLPFSHSEDLADQEVALAKNKALGAPYLQHAQGHHDIVRTFGRFPHRNEIFGRETTQAEREFLDNGGFKG